jgi:uncharacterized protein YkwD
MQMQYKFSRIFKIGFFAVLIGFSILIFSGDTYAQKNKTKPPQLISPAKMPTDFSNDNFQILDLINFERARNGLSKLVWDETVAEVARNYSRKMADENFFSHFDSNGQSVLERAKTAKLKHWSRIGENLFSCENVKLFDAFAVKNWMKSPTHRENILDREWTTTGIGIAQSKEGEIFITQIFIKR